jgi:tRNA-Thr(GGU) m(6)t(6)A37 methyltransferase TsaA
MASDAPAIPLTPVAFVRGSRQDLDDDFWGDARATIELARHLPDDALQGIEDFSHAEIVFVFDRLKESDVVYGSRHPRNNAAWPRLGIFAQRGAVRPNRVGCTFVRILRRDGRRLEVEGLDAAEGTPVLDIKPAMRGFLPRGELREPAWAGDLMKDYWRPGRERP